MLALLLLALNSLLFVNAEFDIGANKFPGDFLFGVSTAAYQIEGGWNEDGKTDSIWDTLVHTTPHQIDHDDNGDVACDSYHKFKEDIQNLQYLGVDFYRFSVSWSRVLPDISMKVNPKGLDYYDNLINALVAHRIEPVVTLYHWDLPQYLQDIGGWLNKDVVFYFEAFAGVLFENFGDRVKYWITFNEPAVQCRQGYGSGGKAPYISSPGIGEYLCTHNIIKSHAAAYHLYNDTFRHLYNGSVGITLSISNYDPKNPESEQDKEAQERMFQFQLGWFSNPIYSAEGNYPQVMIDRIADRSDKEGFFSSRLPKFTDREIADIRGAYDFMGINTYTSRYVQLAQDARIGDPSFGNDQGITETRDDKWAATVASWLYVAPEGMLKLMLWLQKTYGNDIKIFITENGVATDGSKNDLEDDFRIAYHQSYLANLLEAIVEHDVNVIGYTAWSLMDNFEWTRGYTQKFGLFNVDFNNDTRPRTPKKSAKYFKRVIQSKCLLIEGECKVPDPDPNEEDPEDPSDPSDEDPADPSDPSDEDPDDPSDPSDEDPADPSDPSDEDPADPSDPSDEDPDDPSDPSDENPSDPSDPSDEDPADPSDPSDEDPADPSDPSDEDPADPIDPSDEDPADASDPSDEDNPSEADNKHKDEAHIIHVIINK